MARTTERGPGDPTPLMQRWRDECGRALAMADPDGAEDLHVAWILGAYFDALHAALGRTTDPQAHERLCTEEAARFLAMLRGVPERRRRIVRERADTLRHAGLVVFPTPANKDEP